MKKSLFIILLLISANALFSDDGIGLSLEESAWLEEHPVIRIVPDPNFAPLEFFEDGEYCGLARDYMDLIGKRLDLSFEIIETEDWNEGLELLRSRKADMNPAASPTPDRVEYLIFSEPVYKSRMVIIGTRGSGGRVTEENLAGKRVGLIGGYAEQSYLEIMLPELQVVEYSQHEKAIEDLSFGCIDYFIGSLSVLSYFIKESGYSNIVIHGELNYDHQLCFAVRSDWPILLDILQKTWDSISEKEKADAFDSWSGLKLEEHYFHREIIPFIAAAAGTVLLILVLILIWNRVLVRKVDEKTAVLNLELKEKELLLHEVHHRVKNNMQMIIGLLHICESDELPEECREQNTKNISRLNIVSEAMHLSYAQDSIDRIEIKNFITGLIGDIGSGGCSSAAGGIRVDGECFIVDSDTAIIIGLILNEFLYNIRSSGFKPKNGELSCIISFSGKGDEINMRVSVNDEVSKELFESGSCRSSKMIISNLIKSLNATTEYRCEPGKGQPSSEWSMTFS